MGKHRLPVLVVLLAAVPVAELAFSLLDASALIENCVRGVEGGIAVYLAPGEIRQSRERTARIGTAIEGYLEWVAQKAERSPGYLKSSTTTSALDQSVRVLQMDEPTTGTHHRSEAAEGTPWEELPTRRRLIVLGEPGSGKSWLLRSQALQLSKEALQHVRRPHYRFLRGRAKLTGFDIPIHLSVDRLVSAVQDVSPNAAVNALVEAIADDASNKLSEAELTVFRPWLHDRVRNGRCVIMLDALDEVASEALKTGSDTGDLSVLLTQLIEAATKGNVWVTSRPNAYSPAESAFRHGDVTKVELLGFDPTARDKYISTWFDDRLDLSRRLHQVLAEDPSLERLASIPLILSFMCLVGDRIDEMPDDESSLYREVIRELVIGRWKTDTALPNDAQIQQRITLLKAIAWRFATDERGWQNGLPQSDVVDFVVKISQSERVSASPDADRADEEASARQELMAIAEVLLQPETSEGARREGDMRFTHRTLHEYLVAEAISDDRADEAAQFVPKLALDRDWSVVRRHLAMRQNLPSSIVRALEEYNTDALHQRMFERARVNLAGGEETAIAGAVTDLTGILEGSPSFEDQRRAVSELAQAPQPHRAALLAVARAHGRPDAGVFAVRALADDQRTSTADIIDLLANAEEVRVRAEAAYALGRRQSGSPVRHLLLGISNANAHVRSACYETAKAAGPSGADLLIEVLDSGVEPLDSEAARSLCDLLSIPLPRPPPQRLAHSVEYAAALIARGHNDEATAMLVDHPGRLAIATATSDADTLISAARADPSLLSNPWVQHLVAGCEPADLASTLRHRAESENVELTDIELAIIASHGDSCEWLAETGQDNTTQARAAEALVLLGCPHAPALAATWVESADNDVVSQGARALATLKPSGARKLAAKRLKRPTGKDATPLLLAVLAGGGDDSAEAQLDELYNAAKVALPRRRNRRARAANRLRVAEAAALSNHPRTAHYLGKITERIPLDSYTSAGLAVVEPDKNGGPVTGLLQRQMSSEDRVIANATQRAVAARGCTEYRHLLGTLEAQLGSTLDEQLIVEADMYLAPSSRPAVVDVGALRLLMAQEPTQAMDVMTKLAMSTESMIEYRTLIGEIERLVDRSLLALQDATAGGNEERASESLECLHAVPPRLLRERDPVGEAAHIIIDECAAPPTSCLNFVMSLWECCDTDRGRVAVYELCVIVSREGRGHVTDSEAEWASWLDWLHEPTRLVSSLQESSGFRIGVTGDLPPSASVEEPPRLRNREDERRAWVKKRDRRERWRSRRDAAQDLAIFIVLAALAACAIGAGMWGLYEIFDGWLGLPSGRWWLGLAIAYAVIAALIAAADGFDDPGNYFVDCVQALFWWALILLVLGWPTIVWVLLVVFGVLLIVGFLVG